MKRALVITVALALVLFSFRVAVSEKEFVQENIVFASVQMNNMLRATAHLSDAFPRTIDSSGKLVTTNAYEWTPGFFPGNLWYLYELTGDEQYKNAAEKWTAKMEPVQFFTGHHDLGFMMYCSYGNAYRLTKKPEYRGILVQAAKSLSTRFDSVTRTIKSWDRFNSWHGNKAYEFPVIIDNMMNLELLFFASKETGEQRFRNIALAHADATLRNQLRKDFSTYHVVCYDKKSGAVVGRETAQGLADNSTWARGQAWGIYGFTLCYRETGDSRYLNVARKMAEYFINNSNLPADKVPYWDFNIGQNKYVPGVLSYATREQRKLRDASAAAITASALLELSNYPGTDAVRFRKVAVQMLHTLSSPAYRAAPGTNGNFLLMHSVGSIPHRAEIDKPLVYADYYFLETLYRYRNHLSGKPLFAKN